MSPLERLEEDDEGNEIGCETQSAEDGREVGRGDGVLVLEWWTVDGEAERRVVGEWMG